MRFTEQVIRMTDFHVEQDHLLLKQHNAAYDTDWENQYVEDLIEGARSSIDSFLNWWYEGQGSDELAQDELVHAANMLGMVWDKMKRSLPEPVAQGDFWNGRSSTPSNGES